MKTSAPASKHTGKSMITNHFNSNVARFIFNSEAIKPSVRQIVVNRIAAGPPSASLGDSGTLHVNVSEEHSADPLLIEAVKGAVK